MYNSDKGRKLSKRISSEQIHDTYILSVNLKKNHTHTPTLLRQSYFLVNPISEIRTDIKKPEYVTFPFLSVRIPQN